MINVSRELRTTHGEMSDELALVNMEIMAGTSRADALRNLSKRSDEDEIKKLVSLLVQTDRFGTSIAQFATNPSPTICVSAAARKPKSGPEK